MKRLKIAILGLGSRGTIYAEFVKANPDLYELVAVIDLLATKLQKAREQYNVAEDKCYTDYCEFFRSNTPCDMVAVCTQDEDHRKHAIDCMRAGYDLLLEKPISNSVESCKAIIEVAKELNKKVVVAHVLRYTPFFREVKRIIDSGEIGEVVTMEQTENVGYWHQAHSFVRGEWSNREASSPMILAKCCHDLDIIKWLMGARCNKVSSFGSLFYFLRKNKPLGASNRCIDCKIAKDCIYNAIAFYDKMPGWAETFRYDYPSLEEAYKKSKFTRCVYECDNNVVDHQVVNMLFDEGKTASLTMTAFSNECYRSLKIFGTFGEIVGNVDKRTITVTRFGQAPKTIDVNTLATDFSVHQGGDNQMMRDIYTYFTSGILPQNMTGVENSLESHLMAFSAEESRLNEGKPITIEY